MSNQSFTGSVGDSGYLSCISSGLPVYRMESADAGFAVIINNESFQQCGLSKREGTEKDGADLKALFESLNFIVEVHNDQTKEEMKGIIMDAGKRDHSNYDCFALAIMSHGEKDFVHGVDAKIELNELLEPLKANNCETLRGKPKLFFIQSCRGQKFDDGVEYKHGYETDADEYEPDIIKIIKEVDSLYSFSTVSGYSSIRHRYDGTWYVQELCSVFANYGHKYDILTLLTLINNKIQSKEANIPSSTNCSKKQIPSFTSMLTKQLYLKK